MKSLGEETLELQLRAYKVHGWVREYLFDELHRRKWRLDFAWPERRFAVEIEGGSWVGGRHFRGIGIAKDCEKYEAAMLAGWTVYRVTTDMVTSGHAIGVIRRMVGEHERTM